MGNGNSSEDLFINWECSKLTEGTNVQRISAPPPPSPRGHFTEGATRVTVNKAHDRGILGRVGSCVCGEGVRDLG